MSTVARRRGTTLAELVVASALATLLLSATYMLMVPGLRAWTVSNKRSHVRQTALALLNRLAHDLRGACVESVVTRPRTWVDPETGSTEDAVDISFLNAFDGQGRIGQNEDGQIVWRSYEVIYLDTAVRTLYIGQRDLLEDARGNLVMRLEAFAPDPVRDRPLGRGVCGLWAQPTIDSLATTFLRGEGTGSDLVRINPVYARIHVRDEQEDCRLSTAVNALLSGETVTAEPKDP